MGHPTFVRTGNNRLLSVFHTVETGLYARAYTNGNWTQPQEILHGARDSFTVNMAADGRICVFAQDGNGEMHLCTEAVDGWNDRVVLRNAGIAPDTPMHALIAGKNFHLLYAIPAGGGKTQLVSQKLGTDGHVGAANRLGGAEPFGGRLFRMQNVGANHALMLYQAREPERSLGYREVTPERIGSFHVLHATGYRITDASFVTTEDVLHALFIVKSPFACQLVYRRKDAFGLHEPFILREAQRMELCLLYTVENRLTACCICGGQLFTCAVNDPRGGRGRISFSAEPCKAIFLAPQSADAAFSCGELYADKARPWEPQLLDIRPGDFYPIHIALDPAPPPVDEVYAPLQPPHTSDEALLRAQMRIDQLSHENAEKDLRLTHLAARLKALEADTLATETYLREQIDKTAAPLMTDESAPVSEEDSAPTEM